jgi:3-methyladenine DNA glycosylase AlkD
MSSLKEFARMKYTQNGNSLDAAAMSAYMKDLFPFYGIKKPLRKEIDKLILEKNMLANLSEWREVVKELWNEDEREMHYLALGLLDKFKKQLTSEDIDLLHWLVVNKSWWDTVDHIASNVIGPLILRYPELSLEMAVWNKSENMWLQRCSILFQLKYRQLTDTELLQTHILHCSSSKEFFIRKAIGWSLREYAKHEPKWVLAFVEKNKEKLSKLSVKEALRHQ